MSNPPPPLPPAQPPVGLESDSGDHLTDRLDALGRSLVAAEMDSSHAAAPAADSPFMQAVECRAHFHAAGRWAPRLALAAAAAVALVAGYLVYSTRPTPPAPVPVIVENDVEQSTLANLRRMNQDVNSPDKLKLNGSGAAVAGTQQSGQPVEKPVRPLTPTDARAADKIDSIINGK